MELLAVRTARLIAYLNAEELNPLGRPLAHGFLKAFVERYSFVKQPTTAEEILDSKGEGIGFEVGKLGDVGISKVTLFDWGVAVDTNVSTEASETVLKDILDWGAETFKMSNRPNLITRRNFVSEIVFSSNMQLPTVNPQLKAVGDKVTKLVSGYLGSSLPFELGALHWFFDASQTKQLFTPFRIERFTAGETAFSNNKYYSGAPLRTEDHVQIIREFELAFPAEGVLPLPIE